MKAYIRIINKIEEVRVKGFDGVKLFSLAKAVECDPWFVKGIARLYAREKGYFYDDVEETLFFKEPIYEIV